MSERHPIDELFHRALHDAEVTPPPAVWEGIVRKRTKRRGGYWGWLAAGLLLLGGAAALFIHNDQSAPLPTAELQGSVGSTTNQTPLAESGAVSEPRHSTTTGTRAATEHAAVHQKNALVANERSTDLANTNNTIAATSPRANEAVTKTKPSTEAPGAVNTRTNALKPTITAAPSMALEMNTRPAPENEVIVRDATMNDLSVLPLIRSDLVREEVRPDSMKYGRTAGPYVLPNADWWVALEVGRNDVRRTWYGNEPLLVNALNNVEVPHYTWSQGVLAGRSWRSGLGLSAGLAYEGSEYAFDHVDDRVRVDSMMVIPYIITLDTQVFVSNVDTVTFMTEEAKQVSGTNRLSVLHVPIEGYWHKHYRRWTFGARVGMAAEFVTMRQGYTLDVDDEGDVMSVDLGAQAYDTRYHTTLTGMLGADVGFALSEHWGLWATPTYMHGIAAWGTDGSPYVLPERLGLRVRLSYTFTRIP